MIEYPQYSRICDDELRELEIEFGRSLSRGMAQWYIRNRTNRQAVERMVNSDSSQAVLPSSQSPEGSSIVVGIRDAKVEGDLLQVLKTTL
jgi:hypothetical protein